MGARRWLARHGFRNVAGRLVRFVAALVLLIDSSSGVAHPLGNNTVNRQAAIHITPALVELRYAMDMAEIPTLVQSQAADTDQDGSVSDAEWAAYARTWANEVARELELELDGKPLGVTLREPRWSLVPAAAGLFTLRLEAVFRTPVDRGLTQFRYRDRYKPAQIGWKEIYVAPGDGVTISSANVPQTDRSEGLTRFPAASGASFPSELSAAAELVMPRPASRVAQAHASANLPRAAAPASLSAAQAAGSPSAAANAKKDRDAPGSAILTVRTSPVSDGDLQPAPSGLSPVPLPRTIPVWQDAGSFFRLGVHHIATGWDHLAFLLGLLLLSHSLRQLVKVITAFTIAHSVTLALAANGWVTPPGALIEPAVALTIAYVGFVGLIWQRSRHSVTLAFGFGLIHGFGFAGALAESLGEETARNGAWLVNLASFNLGIEAFQLLLVCTLVPLTTLAARYAWSGSAARFGSLGVLAAGVGWFVARVADTL